MVRKIVIFSGKLIFGIPDSWVDFFMFGKLWVRFTASNELKIVLKLFVVCTEGESVVDTVQGSKKRVGIPVVFRAKLLRIGYAKVKY